MNKFIMYIFGVIVAIIIIILLGFLMSKIIVMIVQSLDIAIRNIDYKNKQKYIFDADVPPEDMRKIRVRLASYLNIDLPSYGGVDSLFVHALELFNVRTLEIKKDEPHIYDLIVRDIFGDYRHKFNI